MICYILTKYFRCKNMKVIKFKPAARGIAAHIASSERCRFRQWNERNILENG